MSKFFYYKYLIEREIMSIEWIDILKKAVKFAYDKVYPLLGTLEGAEITDEKGAGGDITTKIDSIAEQALIEIIKKQNIDFHLISEEIGEKYYGDKKNYDKCKDYIIMDPIDGSLNANRGISFCCISVAHANGPNSRNIIEGVILNLYTKAIYWAIKGKGAYLNNKQISVSKLDDIDRAVAGVALNSSEPFSRAVQRYKPIIDEVYKVRTMGSVALELCQVADGALDLFLDVRGTLRILDCAASILIVQEAGGTILSNEGIPLELPLKIESKCSIIASNQNLAKYIKKNLSKLNKL